MLEILLITTYLAASQEELIWIELVRHSINLKAQTTDTKVTELWTVSL
jgi:hypothetical protein